MAAAKFTIPEGKTFFEAMGYSFVDLPIDEDHDRAIPTSEFITAAENFLKLFIVLDYTAFVAVKVDMSGNIEKLKTRLKQAPLQSETLQDMVTNELKEKKMYASDGLLWFTRALEFTVRSIAHSVENPNGRLQDSFVTTYSKTLKNHHTWSVRAAFNIGFIAIPSRENFFGPLGEKNPQFQPQADAFFAKIVVLVDILQKFLQKVGVDGKKK